MVRIFGEGPAAMPLSYPSDRRMVVPNGGLHFCRNCLHFLPQESVCSLRSVRIEIPYRTTCRNFNQAGDSIRGPLYAMVSEVKNRAGWHLEIPYYDGCRPDTVQLTATPDTVVRFTDESGRTHELSSAEDYIRFYLESGPTL